MPILAEFAAGHGITYPLLSDEGSRAMRGLGLINERVQEDHEAYGIKPNPRHANLPYPGVFVLDRDGTITGKHFYESYRERDGGGALLAQALGITAEPTAAAGIVKHPVVTVRAWLDSSTYAFFQRLTLAVELSIAPGFHVFGASAGRGVTGLALAVDPIDGVEVGRSRWPSPRPLALPGFDDHPLVHEGVARGAVPLTFSGQPGGGDRVVGLTVHYQACDDASCLAPSSARLVLSVREAALVGRSLPTGAAKP